jgi:arsenite methyltransferase
MEHSLLALLRNPSDGSELSLREERMDGEKIAEGILASATESYPITNGIPRFVHTNDEGQKQTEGSFGYKWQRLDSYDSPGQRAVSGEWLRSRYGFASIESMREYMLRHEWILDAGCGGGFAASLWLGHKEVTSGTRFVGMDISAAIDVARSRLFPFVGDRFVQADINQMPFAAGSFDIAISEGVLHHTPDTRQALENLVRVVRKGGEVMFYVYRKKSPVREFCDDFIRTRVSGLSPEEAWEALKPLTELGRELASKGVMVRVEKDIDVLGIPAGEYDLQRFVYWHIAKMFWNEQMTFEENHHVNFDWYHPHYAHRHSKEEVLRWCDELRLQVVKLDVQESGITVRATVR